MIVNCQLNKNNFIMKKLIYTTALLLGITAISVGQDVSDQNPNFQKSLIKYDNLKETAPQQQSVTIQDTYVAKDWRDIKEEEKELKADRKHELKKMRIEARAQDRRYYNSYNNNRYHNNRYNANRYNRNNGYYSPYYNY